jgi:poly-gamma-glutamate synthesis protein (capsule biosynthesis protein)
MKNMKRGNHPSLALIPEKLAELAGSQPIDHLDVGLVGDVLLTEDLLNQVVRNGYRDLRDLLWRPLADCSLIIANLEAPITERDVPAENKAYNLKNSRRALDVFDSRFVLSLANNHIMDYGSDGLFDTIAALDAAGLAYAGAGRDIDHARAPRYLSIGGIEAAVVCAADPRFQPATASSPGTCPAIPELLIESITTARSRAQFVAVSIHMGLEYVCTPSATQIHLAEECLAAGAQLVQFHHSHCLSGSASDGRGIVLFGTGNYVFPNVTKFDNPMSKPTAIWRVRYSKQNDAIVALSVEPALIDHTGIPCASDGRDAECELERIRQYSRRMITPIRRQLWRLHDMLRPSFILINIHSYSSMLRRRGPVFAFRSLIAGVMAQMWR